MKQMRRIQRDLISIYVGCARVSVHGGCTWYVPMCVRVRVSSWVCLGGVRVCTRVLACMRACVCTCVCACTCACKFATFVLPPSLVAGVSLRPCIYPRKRHMLCRLGLKSLNCHAISPSSYSSVTIVIIDHHRHRGRHHHNLSMQQHSSKHLSSVRQLYVQGFLRIRNIVEV